MPKTKAITQPVLRTDPEGTLSKNQLTFLASFWGQFLPGWGDVWFDGDGPIKQELWEEVHAAYAKNKKAVRAEVRRMTTLGDPGGMWRDVDFPNYAAYLKNYRQA